MEQNMVNEGKVKLYGSDLLKLFFKKLKLMIVFALIGAVIGGCLGGYLAIKNADYTAEMKIVVTPVDDTDALLNNLRLDRFAESLLLDENGLPPKADCNAKDYEAALLAVNAYEEARAERWDKYVEFSTHHITDIENNYKRLLTEYQEAFELLKMYKAADGETVNNEEHLKMVAHCEENLRAVQAKKDAYYNEYYVPACEKHEKLKAELTALGDKVDVTKREADDAVEKVLVEWRKETGVSEKINNIASYSSFEYIETNIPDPSNKNASTIDKGYIKINISVPASNKKFAYTLIDEYKAHICDYVEKQLETISGQPDVDCVLATPTASVSAPGISQYVSEAVKYAFVAAVALAILVYVFFLCKMLFNVEMHNTKD